MEKIDKDLKLKNIYKYSLIIGSALILFGIVFLNTYQYKNEYIDRLNPFMKMTIGYATLPVDVSYNDGKEYSKKDQENGVAQIPDPYENIFVLETPFGEGNYLNFVGGQAPEGKNYALIQHKGLYVKTISFISWESIPGTYRDIMSKEYVSKND